MKKLLLFIFLIPAFVFAQTRIKPNQVNLTAPNKVMVSDPSGVGLIDSLDWVSSTKTLANGVLSQNHSGDTTVFCGTSITYGYTLGRPFQTWARMIGQANGGNSLNLGILGATCASYGTANVPYHYTHRTGLYWEFSTNELLTSVDTGTFHTNYKTLVNNAISTKNWLGSQMVFLSVPGSYQGVTATIASFNTVIQQMATAYGGVYVDITSPFLDLTNGGIAFNTVDNTHPNVRGAILIYRTIKNALSIFNYNFPNSTPSIAASKIEATSITLKNPIPYSGTRFVRIVYLDSANNLRAGTNRLPDSLHLNNNAFFDGNIIQTNAYLPTFGTGTGQFNPASDIVLKQSTKLIVANSPNVGFNFNPFGSAGITELWNYWGSGSINLSGSGSVDGGHVVGLTIPSSGVPYFPIGATIKQGFNLFSGFNSSISSSFTLFDGSGFTNLNLNYNAGGFRVYTAPVTSGTTTLAYQITPLGSSLWGGASDNNIPIEDGGLARFDAGIKLGILPTPVHPANPTTVTTGGTLAANIYYYKVTALDGAGGETVASAEHFVTTTGSTSANTITWNSLPTAYSFRIYQGVPSPGTESKYITAPAGATSVVDNGSGYTSGTPPLYSQAGLSAISTAGNAYFSQVNVGGDLTLGTAGNKINITTGTNGSVGTATLASGTVTVSTTAVTASSLIFVVYNTPSGTLASGLAAPSGSIIAGTSFVINSETTAGATNTLDNSTVRWWIIN